MSKQNLIHIGKISGVFGVKGWLKITSYTEPRDNIVSYKNWILKKDGDQKSIKVIAGHGQGKGVVAQVEGIADRDQALTLMGWNIYIDHNQLSAPEKGEYYWADLVGLDVENMEGIQLGKVESLFETGANNVILISGERERAIPFLQGQTVKSIDLETGKILVDWDADF